MWKRCGKQWRASKAARRENFRRYPSTCATWILKILGGQLVITDLVFLAFAWFGKDWDLSAGVIEVWLAATVVQIVGIVLVVTRHLFPERADSPTTG